MTGGKASVTDAVRILRDACASYVFEPVAVFKRSGDHPWPLTARSETDLESQLGDGGHFLPLPKEPAALANVIEVAIVDFLERELHGKSGVKVTRGAERSYPDIELQLGDAHFAVDVKVARRAVRKKDGKPTGQTKSRITLYTGNTYFSFPQLQWPGMFRPFQDYTGHVDIIVLYTLDVASLRRANDLELLVVEPWKVASRDRSSATREYLGAVKDIRSLRDESGDFKTAAEFYKFWRDYDWRQTKSVRNQLRKLLSAATKLQN